MTRDVLEGTQGKGYEDQCAVLDGKRRGQPYEPPGVLEAATIILMEHVQSGAYLFGQKPWTFTFCRKQIDGYRGVVGGFGAAGLGISVGSGDFNGSGLAAARKLGAFASRMSLGKKRRLRKKAPFKARARVAPYFRFLCWCSKTSSASLSGVQG